MSVGNVRYSSTLLRNLNKTNIKPIMVIEIDGVDFKIGSSTIYKTAKYGDEGIEYGDPDLVYGGLIELANQKTLISFEGTTTSIKQELQPDKARGSSISSMNVVLTDLNGEATKLATGFYGGELLYKDIKVWVGFSEDSSFNEDYIMIFRGLIESISIEQAKVKLNLASPDQKRRQTIAVKGDSELNGAITNVQTVVTLADANLFLVMPDSPGYSPKDETLLTYVKIEDEIIQYTDISGNMLTGCTRGALGTIAVAHSDGAQAEAFYKLEGNIMDIALKIMLSDKDQTPYIVDLPASSVNVVLGDPLTNVIFFNGIDLTRDYNVRTGDYITTSGFTDGANNLGAYTEILGLSIIEAGSYITVDASLVLDPATTTGLVTFLSQYNTLGDFSLGLNTDEVDIDRHIFIKNNFLLDADVRIYVRDEIDEGKSFVELELYKPFACYSLPNDKAGLSRISVGYHIGPLPIEQIVTIDKNNVKNPDNIRVERSVNKFHYNVVGFVYNDSPLDDTLRKKNFQVVGTQLVPTGNKTLKIESLGLRDDLGADTQIPRASTRLLNRYKGAAEFYPNVEVFFSTGVTVNIGDIVVMDPTDLNLPNRTDFNRNLQPLLMEVLNKSTSIKDGKTTIALINTSFDINQRLGLVSPTSKVTKVISQTQFQIEHPIGPAYSGYGTNEGAKWSGYLFSQVEIYNADFSQSDVVELRSISGNLFTIDAAPSFTVVAGTHFIKLASYTGQLIDAQLVFAFASDDTNNFPDGKTYYSIL